MMTIREQLPIDQATDAVNVVLEKLEQREVDWPGALTQTNMLRDELGLYDIYKVLGLGETWKEDCLDHALKVLDFLRSELEQKNGTRAKHYAQSVLKILN
jgi:hypothetical protein